MKIQRKTYHFATSCHPLALLHHSSHLCVLHCGQVGVVAGWWVTSVKWIFKRKTNERKTHILKDLLGVIWTVGPDGNFGTVFKWAGGRCSLCRRRLWHICKMNIIATMLSSYDVCTWRERRLRKEVGGGQVLAWHGRKDKRRREGGTIRTIFNTSYVLLLHVWCKGYLYWRDMPAIVCDRFCV